MAGKNGEPGDIHRIAYGTVEKGPVLAKSTFQAGPRTAFLFGAVTLLLLCLLSTSWAQLDTRRIDEVRAKNMLNNADLAIIDRFMSEAIRDLVRTEDFSKVATTRATILSRTSTQKQYAQQYSASAQKHIEDNLKRAADLPGERLFMVTLNLLVLIDSMGDPALTEIAFDYTDSKYTAIRYWAVRAITNPQMAKQVHDLPENPKNQKILTTIQGLTDDPSPDIQGLIVDFAVKLGGSPGQALLLAVADSRIARYRDGSVQDELLEVKVLKQLYARMAAENPEKAAVTQRFTELFDQVMQRFLQKQDTLLPDQKSNLISVMVEIEDKCLRVLLKQTQNNIKRAIEAEDISRLQSEYEQLLGAGGTLKAL
jgi:hypothetical protein